MVTSSTKRHDVPELGMTGRSPEKHGHERPAKLHHRGRQTKFTPENIRQITNLLERGKSREEIAEVIGVTPATLQVTCSKLGISLRRPRFDMGTGMLPRQSACWSCRRAACSCGSRQRSQSSTANN